MTTYSRKRPQKLGTRKVSEESQRAEWVLRLRWQYYQLCEELKVARNLYVYRYKLIWCFGFETSQSGKCRLNSPHLINFPVWKFHSIMEKDWQQFSKQSNSVITRPIDQFETFKYNFTQVSSLITLFWVCKVLSLHIFRYTPSAYPHYDVFRKIYGDHFDPRRNPASSLFRTKSTLSVRLCWALFPSGERRWLSTLISSQVQRSNLWCR